MAKSTKSSGKGKAPVVDKNNKRKRDETKGGKTDEGLSLFSAVKDAELDDVFSKSTTFSAAPSAPVASSSKLPSETAAEPTTKKSKKQPTPEPESSDEDEVDEAEEEDDDGADAGAEQTEEESDSSADSDEEFVHESVKAKAEKKAAAKKAKALGKWTPPGETQADRDRRTVFVGNLPIDVAKSKSALHTLRSHLLTFAPTAKIESIRFRSVPFATPTAALPTDDPEKDENQRAKREKERAKAWRSQQDAEGTTKKSKNRGDDQVDEAKVFIDAKGKRKVAFIKKEFHSELGSCNAYVVFGHPHPDRAANVAPILDPYEAATKVLEANGSSVLERTIRVDSLRLPSAVALASASNALSKRDAWLPSGTDPKKSLFVGGLDYAAKDEDVRAFFEELIKAERGAGEGRYVTGVRIVRDQQTQLGKGFGYVHLADRESVEEILAMDQKKIKFAKRYLRVQPCKTLPTAKTLTNTIKSLAKPEYKKKGSEKSKSTYKTASGAVPKGNPKLGDKIKDLSKEERKAVKSTDADRQARRMAKKKTRMALEKGEKGAVKLGLTRAEKEKTKGGKLKAKKGKIRGPNAIAKMKGSRA
ncbi:hypothetical protein CI109_100928 [Kwoniella shandongensis]|uniref:Nucleolar protein 12 n=1 Tax=Kwoniella shandongensis TaxID=1734106 RepID=A0A5M6C8B9_9TREE|nr:uncharacterized protein CI109_001394 [Kwoniella shandongensis]KAA5529992.1 hypothetical protein CI109_001394 [Kwoniella shandongensis]